MIPAQTKAAKMRYFFFMANLENYVEDSFYLSVEDLFYRTSMVVAL